MGTDYAGNTHVAQGRIQAFVNGSLPATTELTIDSGASVDLATSTQTIAGLSGGGTLDLASGQLTLNQTYGSTFAGQVIGTGRLIKRGAGTLTLSGDNTQQATTVLAGGGINLASSTALGADPDAFTADAITFDGGRLVMFNTSGTRVFGSNRGVTLDQDGLFNLDPGCAVQLKGVVSGSGGIETDGGTLSLWANNTYQGKTSVSNGTLELRGSGTLGTNPGGDDWLSLHNATLSVQKDYALTAWQGVFLDGGATINVQGGSTFAIDSAITGTGGLTKDGGGTLALSGENYYNGDTTIAAGILRMAGSQIGAPGAALTVGSNGAVDAGDYSGVYFASAVNDGTVNLSDTIMDVHDTFTNRGSVRLNGGTLSGGAFVNDYGGDASIRGTVDIAVENRGVFSTPSQMTIKKAFTNYGDVSIGLAQTVVLDGGDFDNFGALTLDGGTIDGSARLTNDYGGTFSAKGTVTCSLTNNGQMSLAGLLTTNSQAENYGTIQLASGCTLRANGALDNFGTVDMGGGAIVGNGSMYNYGTIRGGSAINIPLANAGLVHVQTGSSLLVNNLSANEMAGELRVDDSAGLNIRSGLDNEGNITLGGYNASLSGGSIDNYGTIRGQGRIFNDVQNHGQIVAETGTLTVAGQFGNESGGRVEVLSGATVFLAQGLASNKSQLVLSGGTLDNNNLPLLNDDRVTGYGTLRSGTITNDGHFGVGGGDMDVLADFIHHGTVSVLEGDTVYFHGDVSGYGNFAGPGTIAFMAGYSPGASPAMVDFASDVLFSPASNLIMELAGAAPGSGYDQLSIDGTARLDGVLTVALLNDFVPRPGETFVLLDSQSLVGGFDSVALPALANGLGWEVTQAGGQLLLTVAPEPVSLALLGLAFLGLPRRRHD